MKKLWSLATVFACAATLVACSGNDTQKDNSSSTPAPTTQEGETATQEGEAPTTESNDPVSFRFSWWGGDSRHNATLEVIELYMEQNPHVTIVPEYAAWSGYQDKFTTQYAGGTNADLMQVNYNWLWIYSPDGEGFYDLSTLSNLDLGNYSSTILDAMTVEGKLNAIPTSITARVPFLNTTLYEAAGVELPTTWDELMAAGNTVQEQLGDNYYALSKLGKAGMMYLVFSYLEQSTGKTFLDEEGNINYSVEELTSGYQLLVDMVDNHVMPAGNVDSNDLDEKNPKWITGEYGGINEWDSSAAKYMDTLEEGQVVTPSLQFTMDGAQLTGNIQKPSMGFAISKNTENPEEVVKFLNWMLTDPEAVELMETQRGIPANQAGYDILVEKGLLTGATVDAYNLHADVKATIMHPFYEYTDVRDLYEGAGEAVVFGQMTAVEAAEKVIKEMPSIMDEAMGR